MRTHFRRPRFPLLITLVTGAAMLVVAAAAVYFRPPPFDTTRVWTIGTDNTRPYHYVQTGPDNEVVPRGMSAEVVQEAARRSGIHLDWRLILGLGPKPALAAGKVDLWPLVTIRREPTPNVHLTAPYLRNSFVYLTTDPAWLERHDHRRLR